MCTLLTAGVVLLAVTGCEGGDTTTGGTSGGATRVARPSVNPSISVAPGVCYKGGKVTLTIVNSYPIGEYTVKVLRTNAPSGPAVRSRVLTTDKNGGASWTLNCDELPADTYQVTMTDTKDKAFFDILRKE